MPLIVLLLVLLPALAICACCPGLVRYREPYSDIDFSTLKDARYQVRPCVLKELVEDARKHFDSYRGFVLTPDPYQSYTCHLPYNDRIDIMAYNWNVYHRSLERSLREIYADPILHPVCLGSYWPVMNGLCEFTCTWAMPLGWAFNISFNAHRHFRDEEELTPFDYP